MHSDTDKVQKVQQSTNILKMHSQTPTPSSPPPSRRSNRPPRINIHNLHSASPMGGSSMPPGSAQPPHTAQTNYTQGTGPYWPPVANPFGTGNFMTKGYEGFLDLTKSGMSFGEKFTFGLYNKFSKWSRRWFTHIFLLLVLALYNVGGALLFRAIEAPAHTQALNVIQWQHTQFFKAMREATNNAQDGIEFHGKVFGTMKDHKDAVKSLMSYETLEAVNDVNSTVEKGPWDFWGAMVYSCTIYTTIGYGHITPKTVMGRSITIIYAIIGIPMFLIVLADLGKLFTRCVKFLWVYVRRVYYTRSCRRMRRQQQIRDAMTGFNTVYDIAIRKPSMFFGMSGEEATQVEDDAEAAKSMGTSHPETPTSPYPETFEVDDEFNLPISVATMLLIGYILLGCAGYKVIERDWGFLDAFYFVFISMSTIGFGDMVPANPFYVMVSMIYLIFGLALTSMFINVVQIKLSDHFQRASAKVGATIGMASEFGDEMGSQVNPPSEMASVHGSRLDRIEEDGAPALPPTSILRAPRPLSPNPLSGSQDSPPPLLPRRQPDVHPSPAESEKKKKYRFF